jgi:glycosyltransferase involved in cell wall biosynthesis
MVHLMRGLDPAVFAVHALCFAARGPWVNAAAERAASVTEFPMYGFGRPHTWRQIAAYADWCRRVGLQAVVTSDFYTNVFGLTGAALARVPVRIAGRREINTDKGILKLLLQRGAYALSDRVVANSQAAANRLRSEAVSPRSIRVIPNGVDAPTAVARAVRPPARAITVANLRAEKGHDVLIDAIAKCRTRSAIEFQFAGDGPCRAALEARAASRGVAHRIAFLGERHDVASLLSAADLFILPSRTEAFPNGALEAMAAGLPVIASRTGGLCELIEDGVTGVLVPPGNAAALADAIVRLSEDPPYAAALGAAARRAVVEHYTLAAMTSAFSQLVLSELRRTEPAPLVAVDGAAAIRSK